MNKPKISWENVANWYNNLLEKDQNSYQRRLILPNLMRLVEAKKGKTISDLACGQGFFARELAKLGTKIIGVDISPELISLARQDKLVEYHVSEASKLGFYKTKALIKS